MNLQGLLGSLSDSGALNTAASKAGVTPDQAQAAVRGLAEHVNGGGGADGLIEAVASRAGLAPSQVQAILPHVLPMLQQHAAAAGGAQGEFGGLLGSISGMLGSGGLAGSLGGLLGEGN